jgi:hypothetical protein
MTRHLLLYAMLTLSLAALAQAPSIRAPKSVPTAKGFATPAIARTLPTRRGILTCTPDLAICTVANMPMIPQADPGVDADVKDLTGSGCYDASVTTVMVTALANSDQSLVPFGRLKILRDVPAGDAPKAIEQLNQEYHWSKAYIEKQVVDGKAIEPLHLAEAIASYGKVVEPCNPYTYLGCMEASNMAGRAFIKIVKDNSVTNEAIVDLMKKGYVVLVAYSRFVPAVDAAGKVSFTFNSMHKVVFSGFQPGNYPLLINDVGNGLRYRVRLSTDLSPRTFSMTGGAAKKGTSFVYPKPTKTYLEYEGDGSAANSQVFFLDHIDALKILTPDGLAREKAAVDQVYGIGCKTFLGRTGEYMCPAASMPACKAFVEEGKASVCHAMSS